MEGAISKLNVRVSQPMLLARGVEERSGEIITSQAILTRG